MLLSKPKNKIRKKTQKRNVKTKIPKDLKKKTENYQLINYGIYTLPIGISKNRICKATLNNIYFQSWKKF